MKILLLLALLVSNAFASYTGDEPTFNKLKITTTTTLNHLTASQFIKTDGSKNLVSYVLVSGDITGALGFTPSVAFSNSAGLAGLLSDETGTGFSVFSASPTFTGVPLAPTAATNTNTTQVATTAFVLAQIAASSDVDTMPVSSKSTNFSAVCGNQYLITASLSMQMPSPVAGCIIKAKTTGAFTVTTLQAGSENLETVAASYVYSDNLKNVVWFTDTTDYFIE
jgi:hypothetical protein